MKDFYEEKKSRQSFFSYRLFGRKVGLDASYLAKVLMNSRHIAEDYIEKFTETCGLAGKEAEYFGVMVRFAKAKSNQEAKVFFEKLFSINSTSAQKILAIEAFISLALPTSLAIALLAACTGNPPSPSWSRARDRSTSSFSPRPCPGISRTRCITITR